MDYQGLLTGDRSSGRDILFINLASFLSQVIQVGSFPIFVSMTLARMGNSETTIGYVASLTWICVLLLSRPVAILVERVGYKLTALVGLALNGLAVLALLLLQSGTAGIVIASLFVATGLILSWIACDAWIIHACPENRRSRSIGVHESLMGLGIAAGPLLLLTTDEQIFGYLVATLVILLAAGALFYAARSPKPTPEDEDETAQTASLRTRLLLALLMLTVCGAILSGYVETAMISLGSLYFQANGVETSLSLIYLSAFGLGGTLLQYPIGHMVDLTGIRKVQLALAIVLVAGALYIPGSSNFVPADLFALFIWGGAVGGLNTVAVIDAGSIRTKNYQIARGVGLIASSYTIGSIVGPSISGWLWHRLDAKMMFFSFAVSALAYLIMLVIWDRRQQL